MDKLDLVNELKKAEDRYMRPGKYIDPDNRKLFILAMIFLAAALFLTYQYWL